MVFFASISDMYAIRKIKYDVCTFLSIIKNQDKDIMLQLLLAYRKKIMLPSCWRCLLEIKTVLQLFQMPKANVQFIHFYILMFSTSFYKIENDLVVPRNSNVNLLTFYPRSISIYKYFKLQKQEHDIKGTCLLKFTCHPLLLVM